jgi:hypothetical protein
VEELEVPRGVRIFNSRFVDEIKNEGTDKAFEKSRLVVQAFNDTDTDLAHKPLRSSGLAKELSSRLQLSCGIRVSVSIYGIYRRLTSNPTCN